MQKEMQEIIIEYSLDKKEYCKINDIIFINHLYEVGIEPVYENETLNNYKVYSTKEIINKIIKINSYEENRK